MLMLMLMSSTVSMCVGVDMLLPAIQIAKADKHINKPEGNKQPGSNITPETFQEFQPREGYPGNNTDDPRTTELST